MRIRSIRPEFWASEDVAAMDWPTRLVFIGLWSYVDDNGVGRDKEQLVTASLFPLEDDLSEASVRVHGALKHLETGGQITRYTVNGKPFLHITAWNTHQKVNRPSESRYPLPTCGNAVFHDPLSEDSVSPQSSHSAGEGEKGRRGEGVTTSPDESGTSDRTPAVPDRFEEFWDLYGKKNGRKASVDAYKVALRKRGVTPELLIAATAQYVAGREPQYRKDPVRWLRGEHWNDEPSAQVRSIGGSTRGSDNQDFLARAMARAEAREAAER